MAIEPREFAMPGMSSKTDTNQAYKNYTVKYYKGNLNETADILEMQAIETRALHTDEVIIMSTDKYLFMDQIVMFIRYLEKVGSHAD